MTWIVLANPLSYKNIDEFKAEVSRYKAMGKKILVDMHHWVDIPDMTRRTALALKEGGCDGMITSEAGGFELEPIEGFEVFYRSVELTTICGKLSK